MCGSMAGTAGDVKHSQTTLWFHVTNPPLIKTLASVPSIIRQRGFNYAYKRPVYKAPVPAIPDDLVSPKDDPSEGST
jgi:hypothetical protein